MGKSTAVVNPNLGLYYDRPAIAMSPLMLQDGINFKVKDGKLNNLNVGWARFQSNITLNGAVTLIADFFLRTGTDILILGTPTDLYQYNPGSGGTVKYITPTYVTGTASANGTTVTGIGTSWSTATPRAVKIGDEISFGSANVVDPAATWFTVLNVGGNTTLTLTASAGVIGAGPYTIRTKFQGSVTNLWSTDTFINAAPENEDEWFATNGTDLPVYWNGATAQVQWLNNNFTAKSLRVYSGVMCYFNITKAGVLLPTTMITSDAAQPKVTNGTGISTQLIVHSDQGEIYNAEKIGSALAVYSKNVVTLVQFVGDPVQFVFRQISFDKGVLAPRAFVTFPSFHEYLGHDTQYRFDGASIIPINSHVWRFVLSQQDPVRAKLAYAHRDEQEGEIFWVLPSTVDPGSGTSTSPPSQTFVEHYLENVGTSSMKAVPVPHSKRKHMFTATGKYARQSGLTWDQLVNQWSQYNFRWNDQFFAASFPLNLGGDMNGKLYTFNAAQDADGVALNSYVRFGRRATTDGKMRGLVTRVYPFVQLFGNNLTVTVNLADFPSGPTTIIAQQTFDQTQPEGQYFAPIYRVGRYFDVQFGTSGPIQPWVIEGYDIEVRTGGQR